ncbi:MAG: Asp23/Gls24 family envelope stress response protein [Christensenellaceae bacterium]|jgi:uncharacterized alkaline shock family protein YloU|nr:Asp23/Gls24 family envelope stress response protein [Christensenellaceae bacterium]
MVEKPKDLHLQSNIITSIANSIVATAEGISLDVSSQSPSYGSKHLKKNRTTMVHVYDDNTVLIDMVISVVFDNSIPELVSGLQEKIKKEVEGRTRFKVRKINMHVLNVVFS